MFITNRIQVKADFQKKKLCFNGHSDFFSHNYGTKIEV